MSKLNNMKLRVFGGVTMNGFKTDIMKSGLQKYIRRGELEKALYCMVELDMFKKLDDKKVKALRSNVRNRIIITLSEDIGISDWKLYNRIYKLIKLWEENRNDENDIERKYLVEILNYMAKSKKIRLCSWIKAYYSYGYEEEKLKKYYNGINMEENKKGCGIGFYKKGDSDNVKEYIDGIVYNLNNNNDKVFYWIFKLLNSKDLNGRRNRKSKKGYIIWDILLKYLTKSMNLKLTNLYKIFLDWYNNNNNSRGENLLYLLNFVLFYLRRNKIDWKENLEKINITDKAVEKIYNKNLKNDNFKIDDYIIDMHCKDGRTSGKNEKDFILEGSSVENEKSEFVIEKYRKVYNEYKLIKLKEKENLKKENEKLKKKVLKKVEKGEKVKVEKKIRKKKKVIDMKIEEELEYIDFKKLMGIKNVEDLNNKLCREKTCGGKVMTFMNKEKGIIVKEMRKSFNYGRDCMVVDEVKKYFGIKKLGCKRYKSNIVVEKLDKKNKYWKDNMKLKEEKCVYLVMNMFENLGTLVENKKRRTEDKIKMDYLKIVLFRGIFKVTDTNYTNVLINKNDELLSIDENNIGGREKILDRNISKCYNKKEVDIIIKDILKNKEKKLKKIKKKLKENEMEDLYKIVKERMDNLKDIVYKEFEDLNKFVN
jgi:hypothetical protein